MEHLQQYMQDPRVQEFLQAMNIGPGAPVYQVLDRFIGNLKESDFKFTRAYQVKAVYTKPSGKWSTAFTNSAFLDSRKFFEVYSRMFFHRVTNILERDMTYEPGVGFTGSINPENLAVVENLFGIAQYIISHTNSQEYALMGIGKAVSSQQNYKKDMNWATKQANSLYNDNHIRHKLENRYSIDAPLSEAMSSFSSFNSLIQNFMFMILIYILFTAYIVSNSLISNQMQDKTFENAMLRTLGWKREHISVIAVLKVVV